MWQFDLQAWHAEHKMALAELAEVIEMIRQHEAATSSHERDIATLADEIKRHEHKLAEHCEKHPDGDPAETTDVSGHDETKTKVEALRQAHERIKKHHHRAMAHVMSLKAALEAAM